MNCNCNSNYDLSRMTGGYPQNRDNRTVAVAGGCPQSRDNRTVAMAYVPWQQFGRVYEPEKALQAGTIFADLDKPFLGRCIS